MQRTLFLLSLLLFIPPFPQQIAAADWATLEKHFAEVPTSSKSRPLWFWNKVPNQEDQRCRQQSQFRVEASSEWAARGYSPQLAFDVNPETRWNSVDGSANGQWLKIVFPEVVEIARVILHEPFDRVTGVQIQTFDADKNDWITHAVGERINMSIIMSTKEHKE